MVGPASISPHPCVGRRRLAGNASWRPTEGQHELVQTAEDGMGTGVKGDVDGVETLLGRSPLDAVVIDDAAQSAY